MTGPRMNIKHHSLIKLIWSSNIHHIITIYGNSQKRNIFPKLRINERSQESISLTSHDTCAWHVVSPSLWYHLLLARFM